MKIVMGLLTLIKLRVITEVNYNIANHNHIQLSN